MLAAEKLRISGEFQPRAGNGPRRISTILTPTGCGASSPQTIALSTRTRPAGCAVHEHDELAEGYSSDERCAEDRADEAGEHVSDEIDAISAKRSAYTHVIAHAALSSCFTMTARSGSSGVSSVLR